MPLTAKDIKNYHKKTKAQKNEIQQAFFEHIITAYQTGKANKIINLTSQQEKNNFLAILIGAVKQELACNIKFTTKQARISVFAGKLSQDFTALTNSPETLVQQLDKQTEIELWANFFNHLSIPRFKYYFEGGDIGTLWFYLALHYEQSNWFYIWASMGGKIIALPEELQQQLQRLIISPAFELSTIAAEKTSLVQEKNPLAPLIRNPLCDFRTYMDTTPYEEPPINSSGHYSRSDKHPLAKYTEHRVVRDRSNIKTKKTVNLGAGNRAHYGDYTNPFQLLAGASPTNPTSNSKKIPVDCQLYDNSLEYAYAMCCYIAQQTNKTKSITVGAYNNYPCVMVHIKNSYLFLPAGKNITAATHAAWADMVASLFTGLVNFLAYIGLIKIELVRRSSFSCNTTPSLAVTAESFRISIGLIPKAYADVVIKALNALDAILQNLFNKQNEYPIPDGIFYNTDEHRAYLASASKAKTPDACRNRLQVLFATADKMGKPTVQNVVRTAYALNSLAAQVFNDLATKNKYTLTIGTNAFISSITWALQQFFITKKNTLSFKQSNAAISYRHGFSDLRLNLLIEDDAFWNMVQQHIDRYSRLDIAEPIFIISLFKLRHCLLNKSITDLFTYLQLIDEAILLHTCKQPVQEIDNNGYGSDSDEEEEFEDRTIYAKKLIVHNGMRAILASLMGIRDTFLHRNPQFVARVYVDNAYYEVAKGLDILGKIYNAAGNAAGNVYRTKKLSEANIVIFDINACVTSGRSLETTFADLRLARDTIVIFDSTSATTEQCRWYLHHLLMHEQNFRLVAFTSSGLKNQQKRVDRNHYGTVRFFAARKDILNATYGHTQRYEPAVASSHSHDLRRTYKKMGAVPRNRLFLTAPPAKIKVESSEREEQAVNVLGVNAGPAA